MKNFLLRRLVFAVASALIVFGLFQWVTGGRVRVIYDAPCRGSSLQGLNDELDKIGGGDIQVAGYTWDSLALSWSRIGICGFTYFPRHQTIAYEDEHGFLKTVHGVTRTEIERIARANGSLNDFK